MSTYTIPDKVRAKVNSIYKGADKDRVINALKKGKTIYRGGLKLKGVKVEDAEPVAPATPTPAPAKSETGAAPKTAKDNKDR